jgi:hypothetical protein
VKQSQMQRSNACPKPLALEAKPVVSIAIRAQTQSDSSQRIADGLQIAWSLRIMHCGMAQVLVAKKGNVPEAEIPTRPSACPGEQQGHRCDHDR